jgi:hypothetical protein
MRCNLRSKRIALLLIVASFLFVPANGCENKPAVNPDVNTGLREAEIAANRIVRRFHETLDFGDVFANEFVIEPKLRARGLSFGNPDLFKNLDSPTRERVYVATMTLLHLIEGYKMVQHVNEVPEEVEKFEPKPKWLGSTSSPKPPRDLTELNQEIAQIEKLSILYRKYLPFTSFSEPAYFESIREERKAEKNNFINIPRIEWGNEKFGVPQGVPVYIVRPEYFDYYFIQEKGVMKLFFVNIFPDFKLF